jgi:hypothetical protein
MDYQRRAALSNLEEIGCWAKQRVKSPSRPIALAKVATAHLPEVFGCPGKPASRHYYRYDFRFFFSYFIRFFSFPKTASHFLFLPSAHRSGSRISSSALAISTSLAVL